MSDEVKKPKHYKMNEGDIECIDYIRQVLGPEGFIHYCHGNLIKYQHRYKYKGKPLQDLEKGYEYMGWMIEAMKGVDVKISKPEVIVGGDDTKSWYLNGKRHREDGPAIEGANGDKFWYLNDQLHREDGPAIEYANGDKSWYLNDQLHREDGPAIEWYDGTKFWYLNGKRHREDGPAVEWADGSKFWYFNGKLHREDGPAVEEASGNKYWYLNGTEYTEAEWKDKLCQS
jgi:hypothetical protein